ncbi:MAG: LytTR family transcriptional regulator DNA-binding domain-containing protein [Bacteroidia bacterium]
MHNKLILTNQTGFKILNLEEVISIESKPGNYALFYIINNIQVLCTKPLKYYEVLCNKGAFYRAHRSYIINIHHVKDYDSLSGNISLSNGKCLKVAHRRRAGFLASIRHQFEDQDFIYA